MIVFLKVKTKKYGTPWGVAGKDHVVKQRGVFTRAGATERVPHVWTTTPQDMVCWRQHHVTNTNETPVKLLFAATKFQKQKKKKNKI